MAADITKRETTKHYVIWWKYTAPSWRSFLFFFTLFFFFFFFLNFLFIIYLLFLFLAVLGLHFCARAFSNCGERGPLFIAVRGPLTIAASPAAEHRLQTRRLSSCGSRAQSLRSMWDPPRPGPEPASPALAGRFSTTAPQGKPPILLILIAVSIAAIFYYSLASCCWCQLSGCFKPYFYFFVIYASICHLHFCS